LQLAPSPNFFIIGAQRSATRWLRFNLDRHPDITIPPLLPAFFDLEREGRLDGRWYRRHYDPYFGESIVGEARSDYMAWDNHPAELARRIERSCPDAKLIAIVRDPVERFCSAVDYAADWGRIPPPSEGVTKEMFELGMVSGSIYYESLKPYNERFGDQLLVLFYDDIKASPESVYAAALHHLDVDPSFVPPDLEKVRYAGRRHNRIELDDEQRRQLFNWYDIDVGRLEEWTERDLSHWRPDAVAS
jgi:hypothetical protein